MISVTDLSGTSDWRSAVYHREFRKKSPKTVSGPWHIRLWQFVLCNMWVTSYSCAAGSLLWANQALFFKQHTFHPEQSCVCGCVVSAPLLFTGIVSRGSGSTLSFDEPCSQHWCGTTQALLLGLTGQQRLKSQRETEAEALNFHPVWLPWLLQITAIESNQRTNQQTPTHNTERERAADF